MAITMTYDKAMKLYFKHKAEADIIEAEVKEKLKPHKEKMEVLLAWMEEKALKDNFKNVPVQGVGTGYFTTKSSASVADREVFFNFVREHGYWDLLQARATEKAVESYIDANNEPVPGVSFSKVQVFRIRRAAPKDVD